MRNMHSRRDSSAVLGDDLGVFERTHRGPMSPRASQRSAQRVRLRGTLRGLNYVLAVTGVLMLSWDFLAYVQWSQEVYHAHWAGAPTVPGGAPTQLQRVRSSTPTNEFGAIRKDWDAELSTVPAADASVKSYGRAETARLRSTWHTDLQYTTLDQGRYPAFVVVFGMLGGLLFITASVGVLSTDLAACGVGMFMFGCYHALMLVLVVLQMAALVFYYADNMQHQQLVPHSGGNRQDTQQQQVAELVSADLKQCRIVTAAALSLTMSTLLVSCRTHATVCSNQQRGRQLSISHPSNLLSRPVSSGPADSIAVTPPARSHSSHSVHSAHSDHDPQHHEHHKHTLTHPHCDGLERGAPAELLLSAPDDHTAFTMAREASALERSDLQPLLPSSCELDFECEGQEGCAAGSWGAGGHHSPSDEAFTRGLSHSRNSDPLV